MTDSDIINAAVWEGLYSKGKSVLQYPDSTFVSISNAILKPGVHKTVLDFGFGSGSNMLCLARRGFAVSGAEVSPSALAITDQRLKAEGLKGDLRLITDSTLPFENSSFDAVVAWHVLHYNSWDGFHRIVGEIERVLTPGGVFIGTMAAADDHSATHSESLGNGLFRSLVPTQQGAVLIILDEDGLKKCFDGKNASFGRFGFEFGGNCSSHWIVSYTKRAP